MPERTTEQVLVTTSIDGVLSKAHPAGWATKVRLMRRDATLGFVRDIYMAPILTSEWTVVADAPEFQDAVDMVWRALVPKRRRFLRNAVRGLLDFGWAPFEKVFGYSDEGYMELKKLKPLLQDITEILVRPNGEYAGVRNFPAWLRHDGTAVTSNGPSGSTLWVELSADEALCLSEDVEGTNWYGEPKMRRAERAHDSWKECDDAANRYDKKIAGAHWVVYYPIGVSRYKGVDGVDNYEIARDILASLESSGRLAIPQKVSGTVTSLNELSSGLDQSKMAWKVDLLSAPGNSEGSFVGRQKYLDALKARALGVPERAVFEGQFGTKAESEAHADFAIDNIEMAHEDIVEQVNQQVVNQLLLVNKGPYYIDHVTIKASPLSDAKRQQLKELYMAWFSQPDGFAEEADAVDWDAVREQLDVPTRLESDAARTRGLLRREEPESQSTPEPEPAKAH